MIATAYLKVWVNPQLYHTPYSQEKERCSSSLSIPVAPLWTHSNSSMLFLYWGPQVWTPCCRWDLLRSKQRGMIPSLEVISSSCWHLLIWYFRWSRLRCCLLLHISSPVSNFNIKIESNINSERHSKNYWVRKKYRKQWHLTNLSDRKH